jgi:membrane dipeptidase
MSRDLYYAKAEELHRECFVCDAHLDLAPEILSRVLSGESRVIQNRWLDDFKKGGANLVAASVFTRSELIPEKALADSILQIATLLEDIGSVSDEVILVKTREDFEQCAAKKKIGILMYFEGLDPLGNSKEMLRTFYEAGVRGASLTWSRRNFFADGCCRAQERFDVKGGLSILGRETVEFMENHNMFIDVSHLNDDGFAELAALAKKPFIASHSDARSVYFNYRNLTDEQIVALTKKGGVIGINGHADIAGIQADDPARYAKLCEHIEHIAELSGYAHVGYGFDICTPYYRAETRTDGVPQKDCVASHEDAIELTAEFLRRGHGEEDAEKIIGKNFADYFLSRLFPV